MCPHSHTCDITHCNTLQLIATHCNSSQHTATHCNTPALCVPSPTHMRYNNGHMDIYLSHTSCVTPHVLHPIICYTSSCVTPHHVLHLIMCYTSCVTPHVLHPIMMLHPIMCYTSCVTPHVLHPIMSYTSCVTSTRNICIRMGWLRLVGSLKSYVSFAVYRLFQRALLQKRSIILRSLLLEATPYANRLGASCVPSLTHK